MSKLDELIQEYCPDGVPFKSVKDEYFRLKGTPITAGKMKEIESPDGEIRIFAGGKTVINAKESDIPKANITKVPALLVQSRGVIDFIFYDKPFTFKNEMWAYTHKSVTSIRFLFHVLKNNLQYFRDAASGMGSLPQISLKVTEDYLIPVPPLPVQKEIVRILDHFSQLTTELIEALQTELQLRKKQYAYYRDKLLNIKNAQRVRLKDISRNVFSGKNKKRMKDGDFPVYGSTGIISTTDNAEYHKNQLLIARVGANAGYVHIATGDYDVSDNTLIVDIMDEVSLKFIYYQLSTMNLHQYAKGGGQPLVTAGQMKELELLLPPLDEQKRIVSILDRFDALCNDLSSGIPAEIAARQKQYEYYRDKLLNFKALAQ